MNYQECRKTVIDYLLDDSCSVLALTGAWGTGKTHLWKEEIQPEYTARKVVYVSLFGLRSLAELKSEIFVAASEDLASNQTGWSNSLQRLFKREHKQFAQRLMDRALKNYGSSIGEIAALFLRNIITEKLIVVDDIERMHDSFCLDELLGFINEMTQAQKVKFLLILNTPKLRDRELWNKLHEKVIDHEIMLKPSASEAFAIASNRSEDPILSEAARCLNILRVTNIRVIRRVIANLRRVSLAAGKSSISPNAWVPTVVLMTCIKNRVLRNAPTLSDICKYDPIKAMMTDLNTKSQRERRSEKLIGALGINSTGDFERAIKAFLEFGNLDQSRVVSFFQQRSLEAVNKEGKQKLENFYFEAFWGIKSTTSDIERLAKDLRDHVPSMDIGDISRLTDCLERIGFKALADEFVQEWVVTFDSSQVAVQIRNGTFAPTRTFHRTIENAIERLKESLGSIGIAKAVLDFFESRTFSHELSQAIEQTSLDEFKNAVVSLDARTLANFSRTIMELSEIGGTERSKRARLRELLRDACEQLIACEPDAHAARVAKNILGVLA